MYSKGQIRAIGEALLMKMEPLASWGNEKTKCTILVNIKCYCPD